MSTYKVIQDIEAEDKLLGPLGLRQFLYAVIVCVLGFIAFKIALVAWWAALPFLPPMGLFGLLAAPIGKDQSSEVWLLAKIRFFLKPRKRIWDQSGISQLVTITAPKKIERVLTDGLSQTEVKSRLRALANTIDSRGWAVKNVNVNLYAQPAYVGAGDNSDRLVSSSMLPQDVPGYDVMATDDILDERNNPTAQHLDQMIAASTQAHRQQVMQQMQQQVPSATQQASKQPADYWFMNNQSQPTPQGYSAFQPTSAVLPGQAPQSAQTTATPTAAEEEFLQARHKEAEHDNPAFGHLKTISPTGSKKHTKQHHKNPVQSVETKKETPAPNPAIQQLAQNDDLNISTLARQANKQTGDDEVVISLR